MSPFEIGVLVLLALIIAAIALHALMPAWYKKTVAPVAPTVDPILAEIRNLANSIGKSTPPQPPINVTVHPPSVTVTTAAPSAPAGAAAAPPAYKPGSDQDPAVVANKAKIAHFIATAIITPAMLAAVDLLELGGLLTNVGLSQSTSLDFVTGAVVYQGGKPDQGFMIQGKIITGVPLTAAETVYITNSVAPNYFTGSDNNGVITVTRRPVGP